MRPKSSCGDRERALSRRRLRALKMTTHALPRGPTCSPGCRDCTFSGCRRIFEPAPARPPGRAMAPSLRTLPDIVSSPFTSRTLSRGPCPHLDVKFGLLVEPNVFKAPAIKDAVDHHP